MNPQSIVFTLNQPNEKHLDKTGYLRQLTTDKPLTRLNMPCRCFGQLPLFISKLTHNPDSK